MNPTEIDAHLRHWKQRQQRRQQRLREAAAAGASPGRDARCALCGRPDEPLLEAFLGGPGGEKRFDLCTSCAQGETIKEIIATGGWLELERRLLRNTT